MNKKILDYKDFGIEDTDKEIDFKVEIRRKVKEKAEEQKEKYEEGKVGHDIGEILERLGTILPGFKIDRVVELYSEAVREAAEELEIEKEVE